MSTYEVVGGDSLWCIAAETIRARSGERATSAAVAGFWPRVYAANRRIIGEDPNLIFPGQQLIIPDP
jgi:nucleoid-associated protein YgaU